MSRSKRKNQLAAIIAAYLYTCMRAGTWSLHQKAQSGAVRSLSGAGGVLETSGAGDPGDNRKQRRQRSDLSIDLLTICMDDAC